VNISNDEIHISRRTWIYVAITVPLTLITIAIWLIGTNKDKISQWMPASCRNQPRNDSADFTDLEQGIK
jgi:hypothetical protein